MLKILRVKAYGFRLLEDGLEINLLTRSKVSDRDLIKQTLKIDENLYSFKTVAVVGPNASGKSSICTLLVWASFLLYSGRLPAKPIDFRGETAKIEIDFYKDGIIYFYEGTFKKPTYLTGSSFLMPFLAEERLERRKYSKTKGKKCLEDAGREKVGLRPAVADASAISDFGKDLRFSYFADNHASDAFGFSIVRNSFFDFLQNADREIAASILGILDPSIETLRLKNGNLVEFARRGEEIRTITREELVSILSSGTIRGLELYLRAYEMLKRGGLLLVDEIENSFHKNLIENLIFLFNDRDSNPHGAQLIFTTHFTEALDLLYRLDSIFIAHKEGNSVTIKNLKGEYNLRAGLLTSNQFDAGIFDTNLNYESLMDVRRRIIDGVGHPLDVRRDD